MTLITIPKRLAKMGDLVLVPKREYKEFLKFQSIKTFTPTTAQKRALIRARRDFAKGKAITLAELRRELDSRRTS